MPIEEQEFEFTDSDFDCLRKLVVEHAGISLSEYKRDLIYGRLAKRLRAHGLSRFSDYCHLLQHDPQAEFEFFINAITTNLTSFFREHHHFDFLTDELRRMLEQHDQRRLRLRIWSAGCSTGEEPYSLAMTLDEAIQDIDKHDIRILATDLDSNVVKTAAHGIYPKSGIAGLDKRYLKRWFLRGKGEQAGKVMTSPSLRKLIHFHQLNLMHDWPMQGPFDTIFCRNVVIYFDDATKRTLFERFANMLKPEGLLFVGHAETLRNISSRFELIGKTIYRKID
jgi:chemotaxis protein methyltransferase CheR